MAEKHEPAAEGAIVAEVEPAAETLLDLILADDPAHGGAAPPEPTRIHGVVVGRVAEIGDAGEPLVDVPGQAVPRAIPARAMVALDATHVGREVALMFEGGDPERPIVMGLMHTPRAAAPAAPVEASADGERLVFEADKEIVLRCGESSITLTRAGKILIKGAYVLSRSSGVNRILGGSGADQLTTA